MRQHINLLHAGLFPKREAWRSSHAAWAVGGMAAVALLAALVLRHLATDRTEQALVSEQALAALQARVAGLGDTVRPSRHAAELQRLRAVESGQRQVRAALDSGAAGRTQGYAEYFMALSRQAQPSVWLTAFSVSADGAALELQGRMTDPHRLPDYLRHLNSEPLFKGRTFAQMNLKAVDAAASGGATGNPGPASTVTEFALRAVPAMPALPALPAGPAVRAAPEARP